MSETLKNAHKVLQEMKADCLDWDCSASRPDTIQGSYPEFCQATAAIEQAVLYLDVPKTEVPFLQVQSYFVRNVFRRHP